MPDYQEMYFTLFRATEAAISQLILAQQQCEELFMQETPPALTLFPPKKPEE